MKLVATTLCLVLLAYGMPAAGDVWKWVDANGKTHYVETNKPIYTWTDDNGEAHYSDAPDHEDAVAVVLVWYSRGTLADVLPDDDVQGVEPGGTGNPEQISEQQAEFEQAQARACERATQIYDSYLNAPRLYRTGEDGEREYLSKTEAARTVRETRARKNDLCR